MAEYNGIKCDQCPAHTSEPAGWLVAIERPDLGGVIYEPLESLSDQLTLPYVIRHLCGYTCARIDFNLWLDRHKQLNLQRKGKAA